MNKVLIGAAIAALTAAYACSDERTSSPQHPTACRAIDGDTLDCDGERIRLNGIDAPEMPGHCRRGRQCVDGDPFASRDTLAALVSMSSDGVTVTPLKRDRYGRTVAQVSIAGTDASCWQIARDQAQYVARWDEGDTTRRACSL